MSGLRFLELSNFTYGDEHEKRDDIVANTRTGKKLKYNALKKDRNRDLPAFTKHRKVDKDRGLVRTLL